jgi:DNA polymerase
MKCVDPGGDFDSWREVARRMLDQDVPPHEILWEADHGLFAAETLIDASAARPFKVPAGFVELAKNVACHRDPARWGLIYQILWRIIRGGERNLLAIASDPEMARARMMEKNVRREVHKMHAFVRFKLIDTDETTGRERYVAWFEPEHFIIEAGAPFFRNRFANMDWSIFTPKGCVHWNGVRLTLTPGIPNNPVEDPDALEDAWRTYYRSIFNPARVKVKAMQTEMPKRYWKNLPEADLIEELIEGSKKRVTGMLQEPLRPVKPQPKNAYLDKLRDLSREESGS